VWGWWWVVAGAGGGGGGEGGGNYLAPEIRGDAAGGHRYFHRPLGWYVDVLARAGMAVVRIFEPPGTPAGAGPEGWSEAVRRAAGVPVVLGEVAIPVTPGLALPVGPRSRIPGAK